MAAQRIEYKFTVNGWVSQEQFADTIAGCTITDGTYTNRVLTVPNSPEVAIPIAYWNSCETYAPPSDGNIDTEPVEIPPPGC